MNQHVDVLVIGAGQAGLALGWHLRQHGVSFLIVDAAGAVGHTWRSRWDSLRLFTAAQYDALPGLPFPAPAGTYPSKDDVADYLTRYAIEFELPIRLNTPVTRLRRAVDHFVAETPAATITAGRVVVATGPFQTPVVPALATGLDADIVQVHSSAYRNPSQLPDGPVLVVGSGNSGLQIARELADSRPVTIATGKAATMLPQRLLGADLFWWLTRLGVITKPAGSMLARRLQARGDLVIGTRWRDLTDLGVRLQPRLIALSGRTATFADGASAEIGSVVWATGFRPDYSWLDVPDAVVDGAVVHERGLSPVSGLAFVGLPWLHTRGSALLGFVHHDAAWLVKRLLSGTGLPQRSVVAVD